MLSNYTPKTYSRYQSALATLAAAGMVSTQAQTMRPAIPQRTADSLVVAPTPTMAPVITCVVDAGMPATALITSVALQRHLSALHKIARVESRFYGRQR